MNLFTRNSPYCHLLKYLLFLLKHPVYMMMALLGWNKYLIGNRILLHSKYSCVCIWLLPIKLLSFYIKAQSCLSIPHTHRPIFCGGGDIQRHWGSIFLHYQANCNAYVDVVFILTVKRTMLGDISCFSPQLFHETCWLDGECFLTHTLPFPLQ